MASAFICVGSVPVITSGWVQILRGRSTSNSAFGCLIHYPLQRRQTQCRIINQSRKLQGCHCTKIPSVCTQPWRSTRGFIACHPVFHPRHRRLRNTNACRSQHQAPSLQSLAYLSFLALTDSQPLAEGSVMAFQNQLSKSSELIWKV